MFANQWRWLGVFPIVLLASCSSEGLNAVQGKVLYNDEPLKGVLVSFHPKDDTDLKLVAPVGLTAEDGSFKLETGEKEGAPAGEYIVTFLCSQEIQPVKGKAMSIGMSPEYEDRFKGAFADKSKSAFRIEIKPGTNQLEPFRLKQP